MHLGIRGRLAVVIGLVGLYGVGFSGLATASDPATFAPDLTSDWQQYDDIALARRGLRDDSTYLFFGTRLGAKYDDVVIWFDNDGKGDHRDWGLQWQFNKIGEDNLISELIGSPPDRTFKAHLIQVPDHKGGSAIAFSNGAAVVSDSSSANGYLQLLLNKIINTNFVAELTMNTKGASGAIGLASHNPIKGFYATQKDLLCRYNKTSYSPGTRSLVLAYPLGWGGGGEITRQRISVTYPFDTTEKHPPFANPKMRLRFQWDAKRKRFKCSVQNDWDRKPVLIKFDVVPQDYSCPQGSTLVTPSEARATLAKMCDKLSDSDNARLAGAGVMKRSGNSCKVYERHSQAAGKSLCTTPTPRLDDVTIKANPDGKTFSIMAHGANFDSQAKIHLGRIEQRTTQVGEQIDNTDNLHVTKPGTLIYPIYHYSTLSATIGGCPRGSVFKAGCFFSVRVVNPDGQISNALAYQRPNNLKNLDSDGDGLLDVWETHGYDADGDGTIDVNLPKMGANPFHKDLFVEVDWMKGSEPHSDIWQIAIATFKNAPVLNPDGSMGINLHIDYGQDGFGGAGVKGKGGSVLPEGQSIIFGSSNKNKVSFHDLKKDHHDPDRLQLFRYAIFAYSNGDNLGSSGAAEHIWSNDFFVSLGDWGADGRPLNVQLWTFLHELGHTLNLSHGGFNHQNNKPNYNSIMRYDSVHYCTAKAKFNSTAAGNKVTVTISDNLVNKREDKTGQSYGIDTDCNPETPSSNFTYSQGMRAPLNENNLMEPLGVCDEIPRDWNWNCKKDEVNISWDINPWSVEKQTDQGLATVNVYGSGKKILEDSADWARIELDFKHPSSRWNEN